ncbi:hypothetical protein [Cytobacillus dafuensis]|uniref:Uncharacterized protein n=1 Tax=Cytobacillus dafuensis TaxID=1742359 RepID=A0A5B8Z4W7_CYTDA|nr:hypothetical protein [Cytobacillus dafuensis]QED48144.1 hypothetical protein FSZ17_13375 [Cytobacillus dafuensis]
MSELIHSETSEKLNYTLFLGCGRMMGQLTEEESEEDNMFLVGSYSNLATLSSKDFAVYMQTIHASTMGEWGDICINRGLIEDLEELEYYEDKFRNEHILIHYQFDHINDPILSEYSITKNGQSYGLIEEKQKWIINSIFPNENGFEMEKEEYDIWRSASGLYTIREFIHQISAMKECSMEEAFSVFTAYLPFFHKAGLWTIEYCGDLHRNRTEQTGNDKFFNVSELNVNSLILSVGEVFGESGDEIMIIIGDKKVPLHAYEYFIWTLCRIRNASISNIHKAFKMDINVLKSVITSLMKKRLILLWSGNWSLSSECPISIVPHGNSVGFITNDTYTAKDIITGEAQPISKALYFIWVFAQKYVSLSMTLQALSEVMEISQEEAELLIRDGIPQLLEKGLISLQIFEKDNIEE